MSEHAKVRWPWNLETDLLVSLIFDSSPQQINLNLFSHLSYPLADGSALVNSMFIQSNNHPICQTRLRIPCGKRGRNFSSTTREVQNKRRLRKNFMASSRRQQGAELVLAALRPTAESVFDVWTCQSLVAWDPYIKLACKFLINCWPKRYL